MLGLISCFAVGSGGTFLLTSDGQTWQSENVGGTSKNMYAITCPFGNTCYAVGAGSTILQTTSAGSTWSWTAEYMQATPYYYGLDGHGSVVNVTDQSGTIQNQYRYDPYGNSLARTENATIANPWQYAGGYYEAESGLYLMGARYYDPSLGLFLQVDPAGSNGVSEYSYAGDNPCNNDDPSGMAPCATGVVIEYQSPQKGWSYYKLVLTSNVGPMWGLNYQLGWVNESRGGDDMPLRQAVKDGLAGGTKGEDWIAGETVVETGRIRTGSGTVSITMTGSFTSLEPGTFAQQCRFSAAGVINVS